MNDKVMASISILMMLLIILVPIFLAIFYVRKIRISRKFAKNVETIGYCLLFGSIIWQSVIKDILMKSFADGDIFTINEKLNVIYLYLQAIIGNSAINTGDLAKQFRMDYVSDFARFQVLLTNIIGGVLAFISTLCISIGRFYDLSKED
jgi:hypothetical protein